MCWLNYITLNSVAPIANLHQISDAGAGEGLMLLHPTRDTELIACGKANTLLNGQYLPSPVLDNGSVTPAILVHGIFKALQEQGHKIRLHCYQLGLDSKPDFSGCEVDEVVTYYCETGQEAKLIQNTLVPELRRQSLKGEKHLIAESGIGGTTFATLWLQRWINSKLWFAGSTKDKKKLAMKRLVLSQLIEKTAQLPLRASAYTDSNVFSDPVQRACCALLANDLEQVNFAGGAMIFAPVIAMGEGIKVINVSVATTRWVFESPDSRVVAEALPNNCEIRIPKVEFYQSKYHAIRMYEDGYVIEGCGLGAILEFAEQQGIQNSALVASLDKAVAPWFE
ncbi:MAG: hypothetical protein V5788_05170 [Shewanella sp.]